MILVADALLLVEWLLVVKWSLVKVGEVRGLVHRTGPAPALPAIEHEPLH